MIDVAIKAAKLAGAHAKAAFEEPGFVPTSQKENRTVVSEIDRQCEKIILDIIQKEFPTHAFVAEESGKSEHSSEYEWYVDPIDGTSNFTRNIPHFNVSIALLHQGKPLLGVVYNPVTNELYAAETGRGAQRNGNLLIAPEELKEIDRSLVVLNRGVTAKEKKRVKEIFQRVVDQTRSYRILGSCALDICYTANGTFDAFIANGSYLYDCAAGNIIAREAGPSSN